MTYNSKETLKSVCWIVVLLGVGYLHYLYSFANFFSQYWWMSWLDIGIYFLLGGIFSLLITNLSNWIRGSEAEEDVADVLDDLPTGFLIIGDINLINRGNIDIVVVGPTGLWIIEVKSHAGKITHDRGELLRDGGNLEKNFLKQAWAEAYSLRDFLKVRLNREFKIQPVIVFNSSDAKLHFGLIKVEGVYVIKSEWLNELITKRGPENLDDKTIRVIIDELTKTKL